MTSIFEPGLTLSQQQRIAWDYAEARLADAGLGCDDKAERWNCPILGLAGGYIMSLNVDTIGWTIAFDCPCGNDTAMHYRFADVDPFSMTIDFYTDRHGNTYTAEQWVEVNR